MHLALLFRRLSLISAFFLAVPSLYAQPETELLEEWKSVQKTRNFRRNPASVKLLLRIAAQYRYYAADSAIHYARYACQLSREQKSLMLERESLIQLTKAYYVRGAFILSLEASSRILRISSRLGEQSSAQIAEAYNAIGLVFLSQKKYPNAIFEFKRATALNIRHKSMKGLAVNYLNQGVCFDATSQKDSALWYLSKARSIAQKENNLVLLHMALNWTGEVYFNSQLYSQAISYYQKTLQASRNYWERTFANSGLAQSLLMLGQYQKAADYGRLALQQAEAMNSRWDASRAARILSEIYARQNDYQHAYRYLKTHQQYENEMFDEVREKEINYLHLQQKTVENRQLTHENELKQQQLRFNRVIIFLIGLGALLVIGGALLIYRSSRKRFRLNLQLEKNNKSIQLQKDKIEQQNKELSRLNYTKDQLFYILGHDLRAPLASVQQAAELLCDGAFSADEQKIILEGFYREITLVTNMVNNMLHWALGQQKGIRAEPAVVDLAAIGVDIFCLYEIIARNKGIELFRQPSDPVLAYADPDQARVIIRNIVGNAVKFTNSGGSVSLSFEEDDEWCKVHIKDTGVGMTEEKISRLFSSVGKSISTYGTKSESGTGLGLMMVKQFVDANQGTIEIRSRHNEGTEVVVSLPKAISAIT